MRKSVVCIGLAAIVGLAGFASADTLAVTNAAAMGGTTWGLEVVHDNLDTAYVQDDTPAAETIYRFTFLFRAGTVTGAATNWRQLIFMASGPNPNPAAPACPADPAVAIRTLSMYLYEVGGGAVPTVQLWAKGNQCGDQGASRVYISPNTAYRLCGEWWTGASATGGVGIAVVDPAAACPAHGDPAWHSVSFSNQLTAVELVRMGTPRTNTYGAGEAITMHFDEFASFRTLNP